MIKRSYFEEPKPRFEGIGKYLAVGALIGIALISSNLRCTPSKNYLEVNIGNEPYAAPRVITNEDNLKNSKEFYALGER
mgnify:CR=1 FL=1